MRATKRSAGAPTGGAAPRAGISVAYVGLCGAADLLLSGVLARLLAGTATGVLPLLLFLAFFLPLGALALLGTEPADRAVTRLLTRSAHPAPDRPPTGAPAGQPRD
ncbi:hypothetical protein [Kitasatospora sp. NPDC088783]|uniref:hypothetical protein n=1 Tax=Kitasatospora sp. NPDC088783 TaxID=3364077 RepID=UPI00381BE43F